MSEFERFYQALLDTPSPKKLEGIKAEIIAAQSSLGFSDAKNLLILANRRIREELDTVIEVS